MRHEVKKVSKIVDELIEFCFLHSTEKVNVTVENKKDRFEIIAHSDNVNCSDEKVERLKELLSVQRQNEIEEYYWQLAGEDEHNGEFSLVGMMVDEAEVKFTCPSLTIKLVRYKK
ncbi:hypothetical protein GOM49_17225 [Clostridium bovifaecis]|uniref:Uncharacterized protein n=1 Tax=Clostridium bovifaecis TaxID=2184719 RepID=A0A6I6F7X7_9CLOT|nr:hypothetical protein GOM49_17225 [Clostridium bovifaecis]